MIILAGSIRIAPGKREQALPHIRAMIEASRQEPGCLEYSLAFDVNDDHLLRIFEVFEGDDARAAHSASSHMAAWRAYWQAENAILGRDMMRYVATERAPT